MEVIVAGDCVFLKGLTVQQEQCFTSPCTFMMTFLKKSILYTLIFAKRLQPFLSNPDED